MAAPQTEEKEWNKEWNSERPPSSLRQSVAAGLGLLAGIAMVVLAFWTSGQLFITKVYVLLVFAGIWALMEWVTDIVRAFQIRSLRESINP